MYWENMTPSRYGDWNAVGRALTEETDRNGGNPYLLKANEAKQRMTWRKTHYPCIICDEKAVGCYSPDLDIKGLCFCKAHKDRVQMAYMCLISGDEEGCKRLLGNKK
jgi:hypothetical protein